MSGIPVNGKMAPEMNFIPLFSSVKKKNEKRNNDKEYNKNIN